MEESVELSTYGEMTCDTSEIQHDTRQTFWRRRRGEGLVVCKS